MDATDREILTRLQAEGRMPNAALAEAVHLSASPCLRRVKKLEQDGLIAGYRALLDRQRVGLGLTVFVEIKVESPTHETTTADLQEAIAAMEEVVAFYIVSGDADLLLEVVVPDLAHFERFLLGSLLLQPGVANVRSNFAIRTVKQDGPLPLGHLGGDPSR
jgi:Lrp/AsnC family leucine-responsive transcriptional regulator